MTMDRNKYLDIENQSLVDTDPNELYQLILQDMPEAGELTYLEKAGRPLILHLLDKIEESFSIIRQKQTKVNATEQI